MAKLLKIDTENLTNGAYMFQVYEGYRSYASLASWDSDLYSMSYGVSMFEGNRNLKSFKGNLSKLQRAENMFYDCVSLTAIDCENLNSLRYGEKMFAYCSELRDFPHSLPNLYDGTDMFANCCLNAASVDKILSYLPSGSGQLDLTCWNDGSEKAAQILGIPKNTCIDSYSGPGNGYKKEYKGWKIYLSNKNGGYYIQNGGGASAGSDYDLFANCANVSEVSAIDSYYYTAEYLVDGNWYYNLSSLSDGTNMFGGCRHMSGFYAKLGYLRTANDMFYLAGLSSFCSTDGLYNLQYGNRMFLGCSLDSESVKNIFGQIGYNYNYGCLSLTCDEGGCKTAAEYLGIANGTHIPYWDDNWHGVTVNWSDWKVYLTTSQVGGITLGGSGGSGGTTNPEECVLPQFEIVEGGNYVPDASLWHDEVKVPNSLTDMITKVRDGYVYGEYEGSGSSGTGTIKYKGCKTVDDVKAVDPNYQTNDIVNGVWSEWLGDLEQGTNGDWNGGMFYCCSALTSFSSDLSSLTDGDSMFYYCEALASFSSNMSSLTNGNSMFTTCSNLTTFNADLSSLTDGGCMFVSCSNLTTFSSDSSGSPVNLSSLTNGYNMFCGTNLTSFYSDLSSLTDGHSMFYYCTNLTSFYSNLSSLTNGGDMFYGCKLDTASVQNIADTINTPSSKGTIDIGISNATPNDQEEAAFNTIASKNWYVFVGVNGNYPSIWNPTSLIPIDGEETTTSIPYWAKPVPADEEHAHYVDENGNFYNILGGNYVYGDDLSTYGMFTCKEDAAANMRLTKIETANTNNE